MANNSKKKKSGSKKNVSKKKTNRSTKSVKSNTNVKSNIDVKKESAPKAETIQTVEVEPYEKRDNISRNVDSKKNTINKVKRELVYEDSGDNEIGKLIKIVLIVTAIIVVFYFVTSFVTKKASSVKNEKSKEKATIQYNNLMIGSMLNKDGEYYVLIEKEDDEHLSEYDTAVQMANINDESAKVYKANLTDSFNSVYLSDESNYDSDLTNFKVKGTTLVKVSDHEIKETFDDYDSIKGKLESLQ